VMKKKKRVVLISFEMDQDTYASRIDANLANINVNELMHHQQSVKQKLDEWRQQNIGNDMDLVIKQFATSSMSVSQLKGFLIRVRAEYEFDMVIVDYINLMLDDRGVKGDGSYTKIKQIAEDLRSLAFYFNVPVVTATQLNRSGYNIKPTEQNIGECICLHAVADIMIAIYQLPTDIDANIIRSIFLKNRYGPKAREFMHSISYPHMRILDGTVVQLEQPASVGQHHFDSVFGKGMSAMLCTPDDSADVVLK